MPNIKLITENLADELIPGLQRASGIYILTSFVMESGVKLLEPYLRDAVARNAEIKFLAGDYLLITEPAALRRLISISDQIEARFWRSHGTSFHPKAYLLDYGQGEGLMIVGSSNLSLSAFRTGYEWNLAVEDAAESFTFQQALDQFMRSFYHDYTVPLNEQTLLQYEQEYENHQQRYPELVRLIKEWEEAEITPSKGERKNSEPAIVPDEIKIQPRNAQIPALEALHATVEEGYDRAMVVMATGLGKTYLAAFFAQNFKRILFVAHREEILLQAEKSFLKVMPERTSGLYYGREKEADVEMLFASIFTLAIKKHRERFSPEEFDLIIIDEFHHAAAKSYQSIIEYFKPKFLLGLTATPDRMDGKNVYAICDGNVAYQIHFVEAIARGWLSPFRYYGIYDDIDYTQIRWLGTRYDEEELTAAQLKDEIADKIYKAWLKHRQTRTLCFCSSIRQADFLASYFQKQGAQVLSLHTMTVGMTRQEAIRRLESGELEVIFTVDLFNEGVDIPSVDTLLFVRPTESLTIFTQQVGRGLRLSKNKEYCTIIDLIGNYRNADVKLSLFQQDKQGKQGSDTVDYAAMTPPPGCIIDLDPKVVDLLTEMAKKRMPRKERLLAAYRKLKQELGRRPEYTELHLQGDEPSIEYRQEFGSYIGFLYWADELADEEKKVYERCSEWLEEAESTLMSKSYKMVLLRAMLERGPTDWHKPITPEEAAPFFHQYYMEKEYRRRIDFSDKETLRLHEFDVHKTARLIARMPMAKWSGSSKGKITFEENKFTIEVLQDLEVETLNILYHWTKEICLYRLHAYFEKKSQ